MQRLNSFVSIAITATITAPIAAQTAPAQAADESASSSLMVTTPVAAPLDERARSPHALRSTSLFAVAPPEPRRWQVHDLVQIIVRETSRAESTQELDTEKESNLKGAIPQWPNFNLSDLLQLQLEAGDTTNTPALQLDFTKEFQGQGDYKREDDLTARLTAEVIEVLPNGNLVLEARTHIKTDEEEQSIKVTGVCRQDDVTPANTILSNQVHDLMVEKMHKGELRQTTKKGIIAKALETIFAF